MKKSLWKHLCACCLVAVQLLATAGCGNTGDAQPTEEQQNTEGATVAVTEPQQPTEEIYDMELRYDDRYTFEAEISEIETIKVTSTNVLTGEADSAVLKLGSQSDAHKVIACGVGAAKVIFADGTSKTVEVKAADISMLLILGQSNAEGQIQPDSGNFEAMTYKEAISQSILCEEGQVYSTYAPGLNTTHGSGIGNVTFTTTLSNTNGDSFVAASLTSGKSLKGTDLVYPLNSLTAAGKGKTGTDSAIAYEWNRVTGDKVWVINASHGGSSIASWQPGKAETNNDFWQAVNLVKSCEAVMQKEIKAGHYHLKNMGYFWLQGEANMSFSPEEYASYYQTMHNALKEQLFFDADLNGEKDHTLEFGGLMIVRAAIGHVGMEDMMMRGPRIAQYYMGQSNSEEWKDVYLVTTVTEKWLSNRSVEKYFSEKYGTAYPYQMRNFTRLAVDMTDVHPNIHYRQLGYNEVGLTAANNMANILLGKSTEADAANIRLVKVDGITQFTESTVITLAAGESLIAVPKSLNGLPCENGLELTTDIEKLTISCYTITAPHSAEPLEGHIYVKLNGQVLFTFNVVIEAVQVDLPDLPGGEDYGETVFPSIP